MYESHIVCQFFREWGFKDGVAASEKSSKGKAECISMLGNMQNKFDAVFGDVALSHLTRFQLIEFKQVAQGFKDEVRQGKKNRSALYEHLKKNEPCRKLSVQGHVAGYVEDNVMRLDPYHVLCAGKPPKIIPPKLQKLFNDFDSYYKLWNQPSGNGQLNVGLDSDQFKAYLHCMYHHLGTNEAGVLLIYNEKKKELVPFYGSIKGLIDDLVTTFPELQAIVTNAPQAKNTVSDASENSQSSVKTGSDKERGNTLKM
ncbi:hypothetical protein [Comamonas testosteroni]|uniref:hypothetical protein n=1 Tax=Comamonas testosteroni TaxID=285 RepID=UPI0005B3FC5F|nr:hypothetical protein [Comamonas testosteroni]